MINQTLIVRTELCYKQLDTELTFLCYVKKVGDMFFLILVKYPSKKVFQADCIYLLIHFKH